MLKECFFKDQTVQNFLEYAPNLFAVCLAKDDSIYLLDRNNAGIYKIKKPGGKSCCYELATFPLFSMDLMPFVFLRDDKSLYLVCVKNKKEKVL